MSFRYTNNLIGVFKHRLAIESAHREIVRRTFIGSCNGIEVTCSGYGTVLGIRVVDKKRWEPFYTRQSLSAAPSSAAGAASAAAELDTEVKKDADEEKASSTPPLSGSSSGGAGLDLSKLAQSIKTATWEANRLIRAAKEDAHARAVLHNPQSRAKGTLRDWYEVDATALSPRPFDALKQEAATPWMQAVRFAKANPSALLTSSASTGPRTPSSRVSVLDPADCDPLSIPVGATHPLYTPALAQLEGEGEAATAVAATAVTGRPNLSRVNAQVVLSEQRKEMSRDEEQFWEKVELIRRGQLSSIPNAANKRGYADMTAIVADNVEEKVELRFTQ